MAFLKFKLRVLRMRGRPAEEPIAEDPQSPFQFSRMLFSQLGLTSWDKRGQVQLLKKCDKLLRELKNLDSQVKSIRLITTFSFHLIIVVSLEMSRDAQNCRHLCWSRSGG